MTVAELKKGYEANGYTKHSAVQSTSHQKELKLHIRVKGVHYYHCLPYHHLVSTHLTTSMFFSKSSKLYPTNKTLFWDNIKYSVMATNCTRVEYLNTMMVVCFQAVQHNTHNQSLSGLLNRRHLNESHLVVTPVHTDK